MVLKTLIFGSGYVLGLNFQIFISATTGESGKSGKSVEFQLPGFPLIFQIFRSALRKSGKSEEIQLLVLILDVQADILFPFKVGFAVLCSFLPVYIRVGN